MPQETVAVIGLGYVGWPVALAFARAGFPTLAFDANPSRVAELRSGHDRTGETGTGAPLPHGLEVTHSREALAAATMFVITVPTPIDAERRPDLRAVLEACETVGRILRAGACVVLESTVYPGVTEEICGPAIAAASGLRQGIDFTLGYSPERINPGDRAHRLETIVKVVAGQDEATLSRVAAAYAAIVPAGIHRAPSIKVAEAAKVIENTQRDLNIALMNELAIIFHRLGLRTRDVLDAAATKWNFLPFSPGLVGGHCIGVDPYYLTAKAEAVGYRPEVILAGRRINDGMGRYVGQELVRLLARAGRPLKDARVGILGLTFKENLCDIRNSRVPDIRDELRLYGIEPLVHDPLADAAETARLYGISLSGPAVLTRLDAVVLAVPHDAYRTRPGDVFEMIAPGGIMMDVKSVVDPLSVPEGLLYWSL